MADARNVHGFSHGTICVERECVHGDGTRVEWLKLEYQGHYSYWHGCFSIYDPANSFEGLMNKG